MISYQSYLTKDISRLSESRWQYTEIRILDEERRFSLNMLIFGIIQHKHKFVLFKCDIVVRCKKIDEHPEFNLSCVRGPTVVMNGH